MRSNLKYQAFSKRRLLLVFALSLLTTFAIQGPVSSQTSVRLGLIKYSGGGDWYANPTSLPNLIRFCNEQTGSSIDPKPATVEPGSRELFAIPFVHMTGHGNVVFSEQEANNLRKYMINGGFLHIDDNYGLDPYVRREMKKVFPELDFIELSASHEIYRKPFQFEDGLPKIHEHDNKRAQGFGLFYEGRLVCFYTYESDLGDGWEDPEVHKDSEETRLKALRMGANLVNFAFGH